MKKILFLFYLSLYCFCMDNINTHLVNKDTKVQVKLYNNSKFCLDYKVIDNDIFAVLKRCNNVSTIARYDIFKRIALKVKNEWLCLSLRKDILENKDLNDFIVLRPCVLNDKTQWFDFKEDGEFSFLAYPTIKIKEHKTHLIASKNNFANAFKLDLDLMKEWRTTLSTPINYDIKTFIAFRIQDGKKITTFYKTPNSYSSKKYFFYYDAVNSYIKDYSPSRGIFTCLSSNLQNKTHSYISFKKCPTKKDQLDSAYFNFDLFSFAIFDAQDNILDVTRAKDRGKFFVINKDEIANSGLYSINESAKFYFSSAMYDLQNFIARNKSFQAQTCPNIDKKRIKRELNEHSLANFDPSKGGYRRRLYDIVTTSDSQDVYTGICGYCLLQSFEIFAILNQYYPNELEHSLNGYFFDYAMHSNPLASLALRSPSINNVLFFALNYWGNSLYSNEPLYLRALRSVEALMRIILPHHQWNLYDAVFTQDAINDELDYILQSNPGSVFLALLDTSTQSDFRGHALPLIRTNAGVIVIPTNVENMTFTDFSTFIQPVNNRSDLLNRLSTLNSYDITGLALIQMGSLIVNPLEDLLSQNSCEGRANNRRGNGQGLNVNNANACNMQHCSLMEWEQSN